MDQKKYFLAGSKKKSPLDGSKKGNLLLMYQRKVFSCRIEKKSLVDGLKKIISCWIKKKVSC